MIKVIQVGLGPIANKITNYLLERDQFKIVGAVDVNQGLVGKDLAVLAGKEPSGVLVSNDLKKTLKETVPDIAIVTTVSDLTRMKQTIIDIVEEEVNIVSTCEELFYPFRTNPKLAKELDEIAKVNNVSILGTGVNPGLLMDTLPLLLTSLQESIESITIERFQDASTRRLPFQKKIGAGLSQVEFDQNKAAGTLRHVGLQESLDFMIDYINLEVENIKETLEPVKNHDTGVITGVMQTISAERNNKKFIELIFKASVGEKEPRDRIIIKGNPGLEMTIPGAVHGDVATCAMVINCLNSVVKAWPGLRTMADIEIPCWSPTR